MLTAKNTIIFLLLIAGLGTGLPQQRDKSYYRHQLQLGADLERLGQYEKALSLYLRLYKNEPNDYTLYLGAKRCLIQLGDYDRLEKLVKESYKNIPKIEFQVDLGEVYYRQGKEQRAFQHWEKLVEQNPKNSHTYRSIGRALMGLRLYDEAIGLYLRGRKIVGSDEFIHELADLYVIRMNYAQAAEEYLRFLHKRPHQLSYVEARVVGFAKTPQIVEDVVKVFKKAAKEDEKLAVPLHQLMAGMYLRIRDYEQAFAHYRLLEDLIISEKTGIGDQKKLQRGNRLYSFAKAAQRDGEYKYAMQAFELIATNYPKSPIALSSKLAAAQCLESLGTKQEALAAYQQFLQDYPKSREAAQAMFRIGEIYFLTLEDLPLAQETYKDLLAKYPKSKMRYNALFRLGDCALISGDLEEAEKTFRRIIAESNNKKSNDKERALYKIAQLKFYQGKLEESKTLLDEITQMSGQGSNGETGTTINDALELAILINDNQSDVESLKLYANSQLLISQRNLSCARDSLESLIHSWPASSIVDEALMALASVQTELGDYHGAIATFSRIVTWPEDIIYKDQAQWQIAEIYNSSLGDAQKAQKAYEELLVKYPQSVFLEDARRRIRELDKTLKTDT